MQSVVNAGLVGLGSLSQRGILPHLSEPDARERVRLVAVADVVAERARECAERFSVPAHFASLEEMLARVDLDVVIVATPVQHHFANAMAAIGARKHVYVQKAMTATLAQANELLAAREASGVKLAAAPGFELCTTTPAMRAAVESGEIGRVYLAYTYTLGFGAGRDPRPGVRDPLAEIDPSWLYSAGGGGPLPWVTVYSFQLATSVLGPVRRVAALSNRLTTERRWRDKTISVEVEDNTLVSLEFESGALGTAVGTAGHASKRTEWGSISLHGSLGALEVTHVHHASGYPLRFEVRGRDGARDYAAELSHQPYLRGRHLEIEEPHVYVDIMDLVDAVREDRQPKASGEQARHVVEIIEKAQIAACTGQTQEIATTFAVPR